MTTRSWCSRPITAPEVFTWPDGGQTPFAGEQRYGHGGRVSRAPCMIRWPGRVPAGKVENGAHLRLDWFPTFLAAAGSPNIAEELKRGKDLGGATYQNPSRMATTRWT